MEPGSFLPENPSSKVSQVSGDEDFNARAQEFLAKIEKFQSFFSRHSSGVEGYKCASGNPEVADGGGCLSGLLADTGLSSCLYEWDFFALPVLSILSQSYTLLYCYNKIDFIISCCCSLYVYTKLG